MGFVAVSRYSGREEISGPMPLWGEQLARAREWELLRLAAANPNLTLWPPNLVQWITGVLDGG